MTSGEEVQAVDSCLKEQRNNDNLVHNLTSNVYNCGMFVRQDVGNSIKVFFYLLPH